MGDVYIPLYDHQKQALLKLNNGSILNGGVGSGKSRTALAYYYVRQGGKVNTKTYIPMGPGKTLEEGKGYKPKKLIIITTARKRDTADWDKEMVPFLMSTNPDVNLYSNEIIVDSWNNIQKYTDVKGAFFIFDEQRVVGYGAWSKAFIDIAKNNKWILLSATPGDTWTDYAPVFLANEFYKNITQFRNEHIIYKRYTSYPAVDRYVNITRLERLRSRVLVDMEFDRHTKPHHLYIISDYDKKLYSTLHKDRWDIWNEKPLDTASGLCYALRKLVNSDPSRLDRVRELHDKHKKVIIFYNFDYELDILKNAGWDNSTEVSEWNGHKHQPTPTGDDWVYLVQYTAGAEGWNCINTDTIIFYSQNYSYKVLTQSCGRIDRLNTPYTDLYYYHLKSMSGIDLGIAKAIRDKKKFNERKFTPEYIKAA